MKFQSKIFITVCTFFASFFTACKHEILNFKEPESIVTTEAFMYVANVNGSYDKKDSNGYITKLYKNGKVYDTLFIGGLDSPKGLCIIKNNLYFTDIDKVLGYNIITKQKVFELDLSAYKTQFLNDICKDDSGNIFVSATDINEIFKINLSTKSIYPLDFRKELNGPNGLDFRNDTLYIAELGNDSIHGGLALIEFKDGRIIYNRLVYDIGYLDGIFQLNDDIYFSDWSDSDKKKMSSKIKKFNFKTRKITVMESPELSGCADMFFDKKTNQIFAPLMTLNKVVILPIK